MNTTARRAEADDLAQLGRTLVALGDPTRQQIVAALSGERLTVGQLADRFPLSRPAISHHLKVLTHAGLLFQQRAGRERVYRVDARCCRRFAEAVRRFVATCCASAKC